MDIILSETAEKKSSIRIDLALELFYPEGINFENESDVIEHYPFANWLWHSFFRVSGNLRKTDGSWESSKVPGYEKERSEMNTRARGDLNP